MVNLIGSMFTKILANDEEHLHVKDYAAFLYRGLEKDIDNFKQIFLEVRQREELV